MDSFIDRATAIMQNTVRFHNMKLPVLGSLERLPLIFVTGKRLGNPFNR